MLTPSSSSRKSSVIAIRLFEPDRVKMESRPLCIFESQKAHCTYRGSARREA
ncbi:uncharacterized protein STEHIDRAFT_122198 [Stereum hirsutum FP-91666 SS1]|uniref:uncharacterized protein n=1 Tax=Stereum hirsutum (strain FP-91666) TaxID=721885 RepID=UPI00044499F0|nr:uncharacterized protein STEHIDRAFT_122198 [Stereum hirsutum FP-91666 SS1]EIM86267.1 hypothetical protein STEHIDRAFT_122198 [Stereum hirsutum FP-91666 SS1]